MSKKEDGQDVAAKSKWEQFAQEQGEDGVNEDVKAEVINPEEINSNNAESSSFDDLGDLEHSEVDVQQGDSDATSAGTSVEVLQNQIEAMKLKVATYQDQAARAVAEMDNVRRRTERDVRQARLFANERLIKDLLPVIDSLVRAQEGLDSSDPQQNAMLEGVMLTADLLEKTLTSSGLTVINPDKGEQFNPDLHEAMSMVPNPDAAKNDVLQVLQKGYSLNGRVIRAAMVIVAS